MSTETLKKYIFFKAHCNAIFDIAWMPGELKLVTASGDHTARLWDVSRPEIKQINYFHAHTRSVKTAVFRYQDKGILFLLKDVINILNKIYIYGMHIFSQIRIEIYLNSLLSYFHIKIS